MHCIVEDQVIIYLSSLRPIDLLYTLWLGRPSNPIYLTHPRITVWWWGLNLFRLMYWFVRPRCCNLRRPNASHSQRVSSVLSVSKRQHVLIRLIFFRWYYGRLEDLSWTGVLKRQRRVVIQLNECPRLALQVYLPYHFLQTNFELKARTKISGVFLGLYRSLPSIIANSYLFGDLGSVHIPRSIIKIRSTRDAFLGTWK